MPADTGRQAPTELLEAAALLRLRIDDLEARCQRGSRRLRPLLSLGIYLLAGYAVGWVAIPVLPANTLDRTGTTTIPQAAGMVGLAIGACVEMSLLIRTWRRARLLTKLRQELALMGEAP